MDPPRAKPKRLNKALLSDIASIATEKQLKSAYRANNVAALYMLDKQFSGKVLRSLEQCDSAVLGATVVTLYGPDKKALQGLDPKLLAALVEHMGMKPATAELFGLKKKSHGELDPKLFTALVEHSGLAIPTVSLKHGFGELSSLKLTGVESLTLAGMTWWLRQGENLDHVVRIIAENKSSLKRLLVVPEALFGRLTEGLVLDEFSTSNVKPCDVKIPALNTKIFKYDIADNMKIPLSFMRIVNAEEIHLKIKRLLPGAAMKPFGEKPANYRTKKLRVEFVDEDVSSLDFGRIFSEVAVLCPNLECFELVHEKHFTDSGSLYGYEEFADAIDELVAGFERALKEADAAPYTVHLKTHVWYNHTDDELLPEETDFKCGLLKTDLPPSEAVVVGKQHSYFVKEMSTDGKNLRVDCEIVEESESDDESDSDAYYDYYDSDDDIRSYDSDDL